MDIFYDTEFHESGHRNPIDLISIGLVRDDGQKYYTILPDFSIPRAWDNEWIRENVLQHLVPGYTLDVSNVHSTHRELTSYPARNYIKSRRQIREDLESFIFPSGLENKPTLWAYYGAYDHVCLAQIWECMVASPIPFRSRDIRELMDNMGLKSEDIPHQEGIEHNALQDAIWNRDAYNFMKRMESPF